MGGNLLVPLAKSFKIFCQFRGGGLLGCRDLGVCVLSLWSLLVAHPSSTLICFRSPLIFILKSVVRCLMPHKAVEAVFAIWDIEVSRSCSWKSFFPQHHWEPCKEKWWFRVTQSHHLQSLHLPWEWQASHLCADSSVPKYFVKLKNKSLHFLLPKIG